MGREGKGCGIGAFYHGVRRGCGAAEPQPRFILHRYRNGVRRQPHSLSLRARQAAAFRLVDVCAPAWDDGVACTLSDRVDDDLISLSLSLLLHYIPRANRYKCFPDHPLPFTTPKSITLHFTSPSTPPPLHTQYRPPPTPSANLAATSSRLALCDLYPPPPLPRQIQSAPMMMITTM